MSIHKKEMRWNQKQQKTRYTKRRTPCFAFYRTSCVESKMACVYDKGPIYTASGGADHTGPCDAGLDDRIDGKRNPAVKSYFPIGQNCGNIGTDGSCTYSLCILGICCNVDAFGDSLEYGGCHVRQTICASFEIESMDRKDCGSGDCRIRLICVWKTTVFGISFYENAFCVL